MPEGEDGLDTNSPEFKAAVEAAIQEQGVTKALQSERDARKTLEKQLKQFEGVDLDEFSALKEAREKAEEEKARQAGEFDKLLEQKTKKLEARIAELTEKLTASEGTIREKTVGVDAANAVTKLEGSLKLLLPHIEKQTKVIDGRAVVVDDSGEPRLAPDASKATDYMGIEHLVAEMKESGDFAGAFAGTGASGGGASASKRDGGSGTRKRLTPQEAANLPEADLKSGLAKKQIEVTTT